MTEAWTVKLIGAHHEHEMTGLDAPASMLHTPILGRLAETTRLRPRLIAQCRLLGVVGASRLRPLRRRRESTARPALVAMRARKPWLRRRLIREG